MNVEYVSGLNYYVTCMSAFLDLIPKKLWGVYKRWCGAFVPISSEKNPTSSVNFTIFVIFVTICSPFYHIKLFNNSFQHFPTTKFKFCWNIISSVDGLNKIINLSGRFLRHLLLSLCRLSSNIYTSIDHPNYEIEAYTFIALIVQIDRNCEQQKQIQLTFTVLHQYAHL